MKSTKEFTLGSKEFGTEVIVITAEVLCNRVMATVRVKHVTAEICLCYTDESRKNATYPKLRIAATYVEQLSNTGKRISNLTDFSLFIERYQQWLLDGIANKLRQ